MTEPEPPAAPDPPPATPPDNAVEREPAPEPPPEPAHAPAPVAAQSLEVVSTLRKGLAASFRALPRALPIILPIIVVTQTASILGAPGLSLEPYRSPGSQGVAAGVSDWLVLVGVLLFELSVGSWAQAALLVAVEAALENEPVPDFAHAYARGLERVPALLGTSLVIAIAGALGFLLCFVPGFVVFALWSFAIPRSVVRGEGVGTALRHSYLLARGRVWRIVGAFLLLGLVVMPFVLATSVVLLALAMGGHPPVDAASSLPYIVLPVVTTSLTALLAPGMQLALHARLEALGPRG